MVTLTKTAAEKVLEAMNADQHKSGDYLRIAVEGGGCSGFTYKLLIDQKRDGDIRFESHGVKIVVDSASAKYVSNASIDYKNDGLSGSFVVSNPDACGSCGCGHSFNPKE